MVFTIALVGYATGASFLLLALMKPFFPAYSGLVGRPRSIQLQFPHGSDYDQSESAGS